MVYNFQVKWIDFLKSSIYFEIRVTTRQLKKTSCILTDNEVTPYKVLLFIITGNKWVIKDSVICQDRKHGE